MTMPDPDGPAQPTALSDPENMGWKLVKETEPLSDTAAYWLMRGMVPPAEVQLEE